MTADFLADLLTGVIVGCCVGAILLILWLPTEPDPGLRVSYPVSIHQAILYPVDTRLDDLVTELEKDEIDEFNRRFETRCRDYQQLEVRSWNLLGAHLQTVVLERLYDLPVTR